MRVMCVSMPAHCLRIAIRIQIRIRIRIQIRIRMRYTALPSNTNANTTRCERERAQKGFNEKEKRPEKLRSIYKRTIYRRSNLSEDEPKEYVSENEDRRCHKEDEKSGRNLIPDCRPLSFFLNLFICEQSIFCHYQVILSILMK